MTLETYNPNQLPRIPIFDETGANVVVTRGPLNYHTIFAAIANTQDSLAQRQIIYGEAIVADVYIQSSQGFDPTA